MSSTPAAKRGVMRGLAYGDRNNEVWNKITQGLFKWLAAHNSDTLSEYLLLIRASGNE